MRAPSAFGMIRRLSHDLSRVVSLMGEIRDLNVASVQATETLRKEMTEQAAIARDLQTQLVHIRRQTEVVRRGAMQHTMAEVTAFTNQTQLSFTETLSRIAEHKLSFARFGDGEFRLMLRQDHNSSFQRNNEPIRSRLQAVLQMDGYDPERLLLGFPTIFRTLHWSKVWLDIWTDLRKILPTDIEYGNSHVSRPIFFRTTGDTGVGLWRRVWNDQRVCVITGQNSRFELLPVLFDNVKSVEFLESEPRNAFDDIPRLTQRALELQSELILIALGPSGTLLAADLSRLGKWAIDIGHISSSWRMLYEGTPLPEALDVVMDHDAIDSQDSQDA